MRSFLLLSCLCLLLIACTENNEVNIPDSEVIAVVGDEKITLDLLNAYLKANGVNNADVNQTNIALDSLINEIAMSNIAVKKKLPQTQEQLNTLKYLTIRSNAQNAQLEYLGRNEITEQEILNQYNKATKQTGGLEYYVRHMLFKDEVQAIEVFDSIKTAADYLTQEQLYLQTNTNMKNVGDLGWVTLGQLPPSFKDKLIITKKNSVVDNVVISPFGAHVVFLQDTRTLEPPALDDVKQGIINTLTKQRISNFKQLAKAKARVMIKE